MKTAAEGLAGCFERLDHHTVRLLAHLRKPGSTTASAAAANGTAPVVGLCVAAVSCVCVCADHEASGDPTLSGPGAAVDDNGSANAEEDRNRQAHRERYHVALQVKLLVDAPEQVRCDVSLPLEVGFAAD
jgi:hypothetical protein